MAVIRPRRPTTVGWITADRANYQSRCRRAAKASPLVLVPTGSSGVLVPLKYTQLNIALKLVLKYQLRPNV